MLLGSLAASLLENMVTGKGVIGGGEETKRVGKGTTRAGQDL